ncbi:hypothetical protein PR048_009756 [Dryococelus australis]|uniref:Uncharacterized protein n=1 Tax=Dryococelus australis TaxID=614101 RepID=A0ABQ9I0S5_9NEOP|nr:hypothetical protein PR048_009756 [Dryococelus australis]
MDEQVKPCKTDCTTSSDNKAQEVIITRMEGPMTHLLTCESVKEMTSEIRDIRMNSRHESTRDNTFRPKDTGDPVQYGAVSDHSRSTAVGLRRIFPPAPFPFHATHPDWSFMRGRLSSTCAQDLEIKLAFNKTSSNLINAAPDNLQTNKAKGFYSAKFKAVMKKHKINHYSMQSQQSQGIYRRHVQQDSEGQNVEAFHCEWQLRVVRYTKETC